MDKRLGKDPHLKEAYKATIEDLESHFVRKLKKVVSTESDMQWYSRHNPVEHPHKPGKIRRVCNAASKFRGVWLNDKLLSGSHLLHNLVGIVFRFRENQIAITADIESVFASSGCQRTLQSTSFSFDMIMTTIQCIQDVRNSPIRNTRL